MFSVLQRSHPSAKSTLRDLNLSAAARLSGAEHRLVRKVFSAAERDFARKAEKRIDGPSVETQLDTQPFPVDVSSDEEANPVDAEPEASDDEDEDLAEPAAGDDADADTDAVTRRRAAVEAKMLRKQRAVLLAEQRLCSLAGKIVLAAAGRVFEASAEDALRTRMLRNRGKLGKNFAEVVGRLLDGAKLLRPGGEKRKPVGVVRGSARGGHVPAQARAAGQAGAKSAAVVVEDDDEEDEEEAVEEDGEEDLRRRELLVKDPIEDDGPEDERNARAGSAIESASGD